MTKRTSISLNKLIFTQDYQKDTVHEEIPLRPKESIQKEPESPSSSSSSSSQSSQYEQKYIPVVNNTKSKHLNKIIHQSVFPIIDIEAKTDKQKGLVNMKTMMSQKTKKTKYLQQKVHVSLSNSKYESKMVQMNKKTLIRRCNSLQLKYDHYKHQGAKKLKIQQSKIPAIDNNSKIRALTLFNTNQVFSKVKQKNGLTSIVKQNKEKSYKKYTRLKRMFTHNDNQVAHLQNQNLRQKSAPEKIKVKKSTSFQFYDLHNQKDLQQERIIERSASRAKYALKNIQFFKQTPEANRNLDNILRQRIKSDLQKQLIRKEIEKANERHSSLAEEKKNKKFMKKLVKRDRSVENKENLKIFELKISNISKKLTLTR